MGIFITFEGIDGCGKSTQTAMLKERLLTLGYDVLTTREPGGTRVSEKIRAILLDRENTQMTPLCEAMLYAAARAQLVEQVIRPALRAGKIVLCDRYIHSSIAYQGYGRGITEQVVMEINRPAMQGVLPDLTFLLLIEPSLAQIRRTREQDRMECDEAFLQRVAGAFFTMAGRKDVEAVDASRSADEIFQDVYETTVRYLQREKGV
jgi:dTMP kinase